MRHIALASILCLLAGCSGGEGGQQVTGKVTFSDGTPLKKGVVNFASEKNLYRGGVDAEGTYTLEDVQSGEYKVSITGAHEGGEVPGTDEGHVPEGAQPTPVTPLIDPKYEDEEQSGLTVKVPGDYNIKVEKPAS